MRLLSVNCMLEGAPSTEAHRTMALSFTYTSGTSVKMVIAPLPPTSPNRRV